MIFIIYHDATEVEIQVKEGRTGLRKTIREINLVYKSCCIINITALRSKCQALLSKPWA